MTERRIFPRRETGAQVEARRMDHSILARRFPCLNLALRDVSIGGLSAITDQSLNEGERLTVFFPPTERMQGWDAYGRVVRCEPCTTGWRVALEFDPLPAA